MKVPDLVKNWRDIQKRKHKKRKTVKDDCKSEQYKRNMKFDF